MRNHNRNLVLIGLDVEPLTNIQESPDMKWHKIGLYGNYLYDGTSSTIEDLETGSFITFGDSEYGVNKS